jgi:hypothetical protein
LLRSLQLLATFLQLSDAKCDRIGQAVSKNSKLDSTGTAKYDYEGGRPHYEMQTDPAGIDNRHELKSLAHK